MPGMVLYMAHRSAAAVPAEKSTAENSMPGPMRPGAVSEAAVTVEPRGSSTASEAFQGCAPKVRLAEATPEEKVVMVTGAARAPGVGRMSRAQRRAVARSSDVGPVRAERIP